VIWRFALVEIEQFLDSLDSAPLAKEAPNSMNLTLPADRASKLSWQPEGPLCRRRRPQHRPGHIDALLDFFGGGYVAIAAAVAELADLVARGELEVPIAGVFALDDVRDAFRQIELRHTRGKLVLRP